VLVIRAESIEDHSDVRRVVESAFGRPAEADLVDALREKASPTISLVAVVEGKVIGHIFFSPVTIDSGDTVFGAIGLAPLAVLPANQNQGVGSELVRQGLGECRRLGHDVVVVLGHPNYYPRFGFKPASSKGIRCEYDVPDEVFMVTELKSDALAGRSGWVRYHSEFGKV